MVRAMVENGLTKFGKNPSWNIFYVYTDSPRAKQATAEMKALCDKFAADFRRVSIKYRKEGLDDSASRDAVIKYVNEQLDPVRKALRLRREKEMTNKINTMPMLPKWRSR
jgi:hypothetical protein